VVKAMVIYDSVFGNTEQVARAIGDALAAQAQVDVLRVGDVKPSQWAGVELLVVGSPTRAFSATSAIKKLLRTIPAGALRGVRVAAFDTRFPVEQADSRVLEFLVRLFGYAAEPIADRLRKKGGEATVPAEGFYVLGTEGPLKEGELERAADWARQVAAPR
jgi:flavodoxin